MADLTVEQKAKLSSPIPSWAIKPHPAKSNMTVIHPMAVIDRLNDVFGIGEWEFRTTFIACNPTIQKTKTGDRSVFMSAVHGTLIVPSQSIYIEQYGGSTNDDMGDALKGGATDALTKIASYLGIGASIYKGQGNQAPKAVEAPKRPATAPKTATMITAFDQAMEALGKAATENDLLKVWGTLSSTLQKDPEVIAKAKEVKASIINNAK